MSDRLCVVMPVYNEEDAIGVVLTKWSDALSSLDVDYVIRPYNDGSKDSSLKVMREFAAKNQGSRVEVVDKPNGGHGNTILTGYRQAASDGFDWVFQVDSDDEMGPEGFCELWKKRSDYDFLVGIRDGRKQALPRKIISFVSRCCVKLLYGRKTIWDVNTPYRLMRTASFASIYCQIPLDTFAPNVILSGMVARKHLRYFEIPVPQHDRTTGEVSVKKWKLLKAAARSFAQTIRFALVQCNRIPVVMLTLVTILLLGGTFTRKLIEFGDSTEYFFQTYQFSRTLQLSGSKQDLYDFSEWFKPIAPLHFDIEKVPNYPQGCGFTRVEDRYYTHHFGAYSVFASGPAIVLRTFGLDERRALILTNVILFVAMLWGVWFLAPFRLGAKIFLELCLLCSPTIPYLTLPHTEVYLFAFLIVSLSAVCAGRIKLAMLFAGIASLQNQTLCIYLLALSLLFVGREVKYWHKERHVRLREWGLMFLAGLPSLLPVAYYMVHLHQPTLLGGMDFTSASYMSMHRAISVLLDQNQGIVTGAAVVVFLFFVFLVRWICLRKTKHVWIALVAVLLSYAVTSISNWNGGCFGVMRYGVWIYSFVLVFVLANLDGVASLRKRFAVFVIVLTTSAVQLCFLFLPCNQLRDISRLIWNHYPALYSPDYDIFLTRTAGREQSVVSMQPDSVWGAYVDPDGNVRKVLSTYDTLTAGRNKRYEVVDEARFESIVSGASSCPTNLRYFNFPVNVLRATPSTLERQRES